MSDLFETVKGGQDIFKKLLSYVPGFNGYVERTQPPRGRQASARPGGAEVQRAGLHAPRACRRIWPTPVSLTCSTMLTRSV